MAAITEETYKSSADYLTSNLPQEFHSVELGVICGSGLGGLVDTIDQSTKMEFLYKDIPGFVTSTGTYYINTRYALFSSNLTMRSYS
jgi:purine-nucleoside phosphorylase